MSSKWGIIQVEFPQLGVRPFPVGTRVLVKDLVH
jgi:hypothetical protein